MVGLLIRLLSTQSRKLDVAKLKKDSLKINKKSNFVFLVSRKGNGTLVRFALPEPALENGTISPSIRNYLVLVYKTLSKYSSQLVPILINN